MAELSSQHVVNLSQSVGDLSPTDVPATASQLKSNSGDGEEGVVARENGFHATLALHSSVIDDQVLEDATARSDTDTSRADADADADGSVGDAKSTDARPVRKVASTRPISFARYSVPKVIAASAAKSPSDKVSLSSSPVSQPLAAGRPRLVAKTTSLLTQKVKPFRAAAPDPMQVWNKNRVAPQPSTKNLTDEELKLQYGIHLTSRLQSDGEGKEAKWADIDDDDEDDWAPETIEWGDGTKTTVNPADATPATKSATTSKPSTPAVELAKPLPDPKPAPAFTTTIGPNATVLKLGAKAENQQAQKIAQQPKGPGDNNTLNSTKSTPAPVPVKSPWAKLPPVEKTPPIDSNSQLHSPILAQPYPIRNTTPGMIPPPAREIISADDFNRSWRDPAQQQLFMPNSGRYESVPENRRRMSRNDPGVRPPALLQRPGQTDPHAPEPSAAFQTNRTSSDVIRRRASSTLSGESAQLVRRMSVKSGDHPLLTGGSAIVEDSDQQITPKSPQIVNSAYQARGGDHLPGAAQTDAEIEAQRAQQRLLMREQAELARKRRLEEEARQEAEKQERIRQKLLSLGPDPKLAKAEQEAKTKAETEAKARDEAEKVSKASSETKHEFVPAVAVPSPPKPPQPTATGEPQQYGMMKVHPMDSVKKTISPGGQQTSNKHLPVIQNFQPAVEEISPEPPAVNGIRADAEVNRASIESGSIPEPLPRTRPVSGVQEARVGWGRNEHKVTPTGNLWGAPNNKALGNGTFDQSLAGYAPQDLSSRASSTGQGWMNGKTPTVGQSPQLAQTNQHVPETRSQALQNMTSPEPLPLTMDSEADSILPVKPPAPIAPPQTHPHQANVNGYGQANATVAGWNNFHNVARTQERAEYEQYQREVVLRREEEKRTGSRPQANYTFDETFKQVQLGTQPDQRQVVSVTQPAIPPSGIFGAVGSMPSAIGPQSARGSRFFPPPIPTHSVPSPQPRAVTYSHMEVSRSRSPSPPPAEEMTSFHPAYEAPSSTPIVRLPPEKAVVKLPPAKPLTPPTPIPAPAPAITSSSAADFQPVMPSQSQQPMTWAARVSMPPPKPVAPLRAVSQPIVQNPSWQERFNGLLGNSNRKISDAHHASQLIQTSMQSPPLLAVTSATKEPFDVMPAGSASVSLPRLLFSPSTDDLSLTTKDVEDEEDLFEDREAGSLPILYFPSDAPAIIWPRPIPARVMPTPPETQSAFIFLGALWKDDKHHKQQFAIIRAPGSEKSIKRDLPNKPVVTSTNGNHRPHPRHHSSSTVRRGHRGSKFRPTAVKA